MKALNIVFFFTCLSIFSFGQHTKEQCSKEAIFQRHLEIDENALEELAETESQLQKIIQNFRDNPEQKQNSNIVIPVVMHVFHDGDDGKMDMDQIQSGLKILNEDFNGLNDGWNTIDPAFDNIKGTMDINFCLASIDPEGNPTTGVVYHQDPQGLLNEGNLFRHAWDNYKYLNIYFPKYTGGEPSDFTAYAYFPSTAGSDLNQGGVFYSSIRWGYGNHSILEEGDDWASVCTHELGHWLNLYHTFQGGCSAANDFVGDTPPTTGGTIELSDCNNNDFSCGVHTNGENYMDYNHRCKKMFTLGQVERMTAALFLPSRITLWSEENLLATGCIDFYTSNDKMNSSLPVKVYPNPASDQLFVDLPFEASWDFELFNLKGELMFKEKISSKKYTFDLHDYHNGLYYYIIRNEEYNSSGKLSVLHN